ncbi:MAG: ATP-binding cassette domain-containing protein [Bacteriovoracales bacterium]|nr:ATP-binding cassette domain-containing protein [Bacteriovoracales bacterium]
MNESPKTSILKAHDLKKHYTLKAIFGSEQKLKALNGVSFALGERQTLAVVGESGHGKSTLARQLMGLETPDSGSITLQGRPLSSYSKKELQSLVQMIFQDPYSSLNPRKKAWEIVAEPLRINTSLSGKQCLTKALEAMEMVGLHSGMGHRFPHMFSGGQRQRLGIARALVQRPKVLICDEPVSALDVSIQAQVLNLLGRLKEEFSLSYIFISHDLHVVRHLADRVAVIYLGKIVEEGDAEEVFDSPLHPYTEALIRSAPSFYEKSRFKPMRGSPPSPVSPPPGCPFHPRCPLAEARCSKEVPGLELKGSDRRIRCFLV